MKKYGAYVTTIQRNTCRKYKQMEEVVSDVFISYGMLKELIMKNTSIKAYIGMIARNKAKINTCN